MGNDAVDKFYERLADDETMQKAYAEAVSLASAGIVASFASDNGFRFTADELIESWESQSAELSEEALDAVAGGGGGSLPSFGLGQTMAMMLMCIGGGLSALKCDKCGKLASMSKCDNCDKCGKLV